MRRCATAITALSLCLLLLSVAWSRAGAQGAISRGTNGPYQLDSWTIGPGGAASGGPFTLEFVAGRPDVGALASDEYTLNGGYWGGEEGKVWYLAYLPIVLRQ